MQNLRSFNKDLVLFGSIYLMISLYQRGPTYWRFCSKHAGWSAKIKKQNVAGDCFTSSDHAGVHLQPIWSTDHINMPQSSNILNNQNENFLKDSDIIWCKPPLIHRWFMIISHITVAFVSFYQKINSSYTISTLQIPDFCSPSSPNRGDGPHLSHAWLPGSEREGLKPRHPSL